MDGRTSDKTGSRTDQGSGVDDLLFVQVLRALRADQKGRHPLPRLLDALIGFARSGDPGVQAQLALESRRLGVSAEQIVDIYVPAAANHLGAVWHDEQIDLLGATVAFARLQRIVREASDTWHADDREGARGSVLVVVPKGDHHMLGATVATAQLRRRGVSVTLALSVDPSALRPLVSNTAHDAVLLSLGNSDSLEKVCELVKVLRGPGIVRIPILVGGALPADAATILRATGADFCTRDIDEAIRFVGLEEESLSAR